MNEINDQTLSTLPPIEDDDCNYCMFCPMMCANAYMLQDQMMRGYNSEYEYEGEYEDEYEDEERTVPTHPSPVAKPKPAPVHHGQVVKPKPVPAPVHHGPVGNPRPKLWHGHAGYYGNKYYADINYFYYLRSRYHRYYHYPYDPYFDYYNNTY